MRFLLTIFFFCSLTASSQVFKSGLITGLSASQIEGDGYGGYDKIGFIVGGYVNSDLSEKFSSQLEIYFINKGSFDALHPDKGDYDSYKVNLNYIEIPLVLQYSQQKFTFEAGLFLGKLIGTPRIFDENGERFVYQFPFKPFDFGGLLGIEYALNDHFSLNLRSKNSLVPIRDFPNLDRGGFFNNLIKNGWYNVDLNFTVRYEFGE